MTESRGSLQLYNTLHRRREPFEPLVPPRVGMYVCGVTVYDRCHLGHARNAIVFDVLRRFLEYRGYRVTYVRNFTDVDDKILQRARERGESWQALAERYIQAYYEDMEALGVRRADREPRATEHIPQMLEMIRVLVDRGYAYATSSGVYFRVRKFADYGKLSRQSLEEMRAGTRVEVEEAKEDPLDFALWKRSKPGEPAWESPWGPGRPGWHIECSAMSIAHLGETLDLHGGGQDLIFPHHENEIAQSEACTGKPFVRYWVHNGFVQIRQEKMSKSLGNVFAIRDLFQQSPYSREVTREVIRYFLLSTHYRSPVDFSEEALQAAKTALDHAYTLFQKLEEAAARLGDPPLEASREARLVQALEEDARRFDTALEEDLNTAEALGSFHKLRATLNSLGPETFPARAVARIQAHLTRYREVLGLFTVPVPQWTFRTASTWTATQEVSGLDEARIQALVAERAEARRRRDWARADAIREELARMGIQLEDRSDGTTRIKR